jgi:uncharacterized membrane protein YedE/YeeE
MSSVLVDRPAWFVVGPLIGLVLVGLLVTLNVRMGVVGGWSDLVARRLGWKAWFVIGIVGGGVLFRVLAGAGTTSDGKGTAGVLFGDGLGVALVLVVAGVLIGYGAKRAGGCTSGNGLSGASFGSKGSMVAMATFMATAIVATLVLDAVA